MWGEVDDGVIFSVAEQNLGMGMLISWEFNVVVISDSVFKGNNLEIIWKCCKDTVCQSCFGQWGVRCLCLGPLQITCISNEVW